MVHLYIQHKVKDYKTWKAAFDGYIKTRRASGEKSWRILHLDDDPNNLIILFEWDSLENARNFMASPDLMATMEEAGVVEKPQAYFLKEYERGNV